MGVALQAGNKTTDVKTLFYKTSRCEEPEKKKKSSPSLPPFRATIISAQNYKWAVHVTFKALNVKTNCLKKQEHWKTTAMDRVFTG